MKHGRIFAAIVYYLFTFSIGILLALFLPYLLYYYSESVNYIQDLLEDGSYSEALSIVGGYYDDRYVLEEKFGDGGIVLFPAATLEELTEEDGNVIPDRYLRKSYAGFLYGAGDYSVTKTEDNQTKIIITDLEGVVHVVSVLNTDTDDNDTKDTIATLVQNDFVFLDFTEQEVKSIAKIEIIDCNGNEYKQFEGLSLDFGESFFADVTAFVELYNSEYPEGDDLLEQRSNELVRLDEEFRGIDEHYQKSTDGVIKSNADKKSTIVIVVYFICIYIIGDLLVGGKYIIKFGRFLKYKVFKIKPKQKTPKYNEAFGHDYNCKVTLKADVSEVEDFAGSIQVRYSNETSDATFVLLKEKEYSQTVSVKAGEYVNLWVDLDEKYSTKDLPDTLVADGYQMSITFKIQKREKLKSEE